MYAVVDACALINCSMIQVVGVPLITKLARYIELLIPQQVFKELITTTKKRQYAPYRRTLIALTKNHTRAVSDTIYAECLDVVNEWLKSLPLKGVAKPHLGEIHCAALAMFVSSSENCPVFVITDDFRATNPIKDLVVNQQVGIVQSTYEAILRVSREDSSLSIGQIRTVFLDYQSILTGMKPYRKVELMRKTRLLCRTIGMRRGLCGMDCRP